MDDVSESVSESENPAIPSPTPKSTRPRTNRDWWSNQLDLQVLRQHSPRSNPMDEDFNYAEEFKTLEVEALKRDVVEVMRTSRDWWPADYGHYGPLFIRMSWHAAWSVRVRRRDARKCRPETIDQGTISSGGSHDSG
jgi:catalase-peroxidase